MKMDTPAQKVSYLIGRQVGDQLKGSQFPGFELDGVVQGIKDAMANAEMPLSQAEIEGAYEVIQGEMQKMQEELSAKAREAGDARGVCPGAPRPRP